MDSRGMNKERTDGKRRMRGEPRMPKHKVYCIIEDDNYIYFPVAVQLAPYEDKFKNRREAFLAGMLNFFGGSMDEDETIEEALAREIREESQGRIILEIPKEALGAPVFKDPVGTARTDQDTYEFYVLRVEGNDIERIWGGQNILRLQTFEENEADAREHPECYEAAFLVRVNKKSFCDFIIEFMELRSEFTTRADELFGKIGMADINTRTLTSVANWYNSHTSRAFVECVKNIHDVGV